MYLYILDFNKAFRPPLFFFNLDFFGKIEFGTFSNFLIFTKCLRVLLNNEMSKMRLSVT